ncbi:MAG TPA: FixH family protein [Ignavibacteriaceae bacterium]|nr:FixH family protein [Ignavibacteriaceae bacterium]
MKISWGTGIVIAIVIFMALTIATVIFMMNQDVDLVSSDYYEKGIKYQEQIDMENRSQRLKDNVKMEWSGNLFEISFPDEFEDQAISGEIFFYRPSDSKKDFRLPLNITDLKQYIPVQGLEKGLWRVKLNWNLKNKDYYYSETSFILE